MTFEDKFPTKIEFEINRDGLKRLYRLEGLALSCLFPMLIGAVLSMGVASDFLRVHHTSEWVYRFGLSVLVAIAGVTIGGVVGLIIYFGYFRKAAELHAKNLRLLVEGPYLRLVSGSYTVHDERYHFRDIHTYGTVDGPLLRRFGLKTLTFRNTVRASPLIRIDGLANPTEVRDLLCEIDASRTPVSA